MGSQRNQTADDKVQEVLMDPSKESGAPAEGCLVTQDKVWSRKIRCIYFLLMTAVALGLLIAVIALAVRQPQPAHENIPCKDGWITYKGKCYYLSDSPEIWNKSQMFCKEHHSLLAIIEDKEEYDFLQNIKGDNNRWIGLSKKGDGSGWVWTNGTSYTENIFKIVQAKNVQANDTEYACLTSDGVTSINRDRPNKFFCNKKLFTQPA